MREKRLMQWCVRIGFFLWFLGASAFAANWQDAEVAYYPSYRTVMLRMKEQLLTAPDGTRGLKMTMYSRNNLQGEELGSRVVQTPDFEARMRKGSGWRGPKELEAYPETFSVVWEGTFGPVPEAGAWTFHAYASGRTRVQIGGEVVLDSSEGRNFVQKWRPHSEVKLEEGTTCPIRIEYNQGGDPEKWARKWKQGRWVNIAYFSFYAWRTDGRQETRAGVLRVRNEQKEVLAEQPFEWHPPCSYVEVPVGAVQEGVHEVTIAGESFGNTLTDKIVRKRYEWEGNRLGLTDTIHPPFEAIRVDGDEVGVVMRRYRQDGLGFWRSVKARGNGPEAAFREILAGPITLRVDDGTVLVGSGEMIRQTPQEVVYEGKATHPAVTVQTRCTTEYDGCMRVEMDLKPGADQQKLERMWLDIPLDAERVPLFHAVKVNQLRSNPAGALPAGKGTVWTSRNLNQRWPGFFTPYIWLGGAERGLCWFADDERGWVLDWRLQLPTWQKHGWNLYSRDHQEWYMNRITRSIANDESVSPCQTIHRQNGVVTLRIHFVQNETRIQEDRRIVFGLMASPAKPMPENWRAQGRRDGPYCQFDMGHVMGTDGTFNAKYPRGKDWSPFDRFYEARQGKAIDGAAFVESWAKNHLHDKMEPSLRDSYRKLLEGTVRFASRLGEKGDRAHMTRYFEEFNSTCRFHEEHETFAAEWSHCFPEEKWLQRTWLTQNGPTSKGQFRWSIPTKSIVPSYRDFACWMGAQWLKRSNGLYFDNSFPYMCDDPVTSGYYRDDGLLYPSARIWARRKYLRRIWVLHQELKNPELPQAMMIHMTNSHILPYMVWNQYNLDLEWKWHKKPFQAKFEPDMLRAQTIGLQTGNIPHAMSTPGKINAKTRREILKTEAFRTHLYGMYVHEIRGPGITTRDMPRPLDDFGYGRPDCKVYNYWQEDPPLQVDDPACKWLLLQRENKVLVLFVTWNADPRQVACRFDFKRLGIEPPTAAADAESDEKLPLSAEDHDLSVPMKGYGVRMVRFEGASATGAVAEP